MGINDRDYYQKAVDQKSAVKPATKKAFGPIVASDPFKHSKSPNWMAIFGWTVSICAAVFIIVRWAMNHVSFH